MSIHSKVTHGVGSDGLSGPFFPGQPNGTPPNHNQDVNPTVRSIQTTARGYLKREELGRKRYASFTVSIRSQSKSLMKHLLKLSEKVEISWRRSMLNQEQEITGMDRLAEIKEQLLSINEEVGRTEELRFADEQEVDEAIEQFSNRLSSCEQNFKRVCEDYGFQSVKKGMGLILGADWREKFSANALERIDEFHLLFNPTAYSLFTQGYDDEDKSVTLYNELGDSIVAGAFRFDRGLPFLTKMRHFEQSSAFDEVHGAELNIPFVDELGNKSIMVLKGHFKNDPISVDHSLRFVENKLNRVRAEIKNMHHIPLVFRENYLKQYPVRDLLLDTPKEVSAKLASDYQMIDGVNGKLMPSFMVKFVVAPIDQQIRLFSLLLMHEDPSMALFLYELTAKEIPEYRIILRNALHFSLQRKLNLALSDLEKTKEKLSKIKGDQMPFETRIAMSSMDPGTKSKAMEKLKDVKSKGHDSDKAEKFLNGLLDVPFGVYTPEPVNKHSPPLEIQQYLGRVRGDLDKAVYGQDNSKKAVLEWLAQRISNGESKGECIALEGPPGTGKTTFAREGIAKALNRPFAFISMGGQTDSSFLVGHGYTYVGSNWGRIIEILRDAKCMDPVIYIDEVDKVSQTEKGRELIGVLTALTDFSQNKEFQDKYFSGVKFDLSRALFIFSYNDPSLLDPIFRDRLQRIKVEGLSEKEKVVIAQNYLMPDILKSCGFENGEVYIEEDDLRFLIQHYTWEAGARKLKENLFSIVRQINMKRLTEPESVQFPYRITREAIIQFRDEPKVEYKKIPAQPMVGTVNGLYATSSGVGGITIVQAYRTVAKERLDLILTGSQGDVMKESMSVARSVAWNLLPSELKDKILQSPPEGLHIHCPEGATPKDGPSAGGAITTAIVSQLTGVPIRNDVAMTGEIDLTGRITKIGGLSAKLHGAKRAGVRLALVPRENEKDFEQIKRKFPELLDDSFAVRIIDTIYDALDYALVKNPIKRPEGLALLTSTPPSENISLGEVPLFYAATSAFDLGAGGQMYTSSSTVTPLEMAGLEEPIAEEWTDTSARGGKAPARSDRSVADQAIAL